MKFSIDESRIVGLVEDVLIPEVAVKLGLAIGTFFGKKSVIAASRDHRSDSHMIKRALSGGLMATGVDILDLHAAPTSTLQFIVRRFGCDGGLSFTGAHYLDGEISIRIMDGSGNELAKEDLERIVEIAELDTFTRVKRQEIGSIEPIENAMLVYKNALASFVNKNVLQSCNFRVVLDLSLGPLSISLPSLFSELNIDVITINAHRTSLVNKEGEIFPNPQSIKRVSEAVIAVKADLGIIIDVEGTKAVFVDEKGKIYPPEHTAAFFIYQILTTRNGVIVLSKLFTNRFDKLLEDEGGNIVRSKDLPGDIGRLIASERAVIGATDNGKIYNPVWGAETDGALTALNLLTIVATNKKPLSLMMKEFKDLSVKAGIIHKKVTHFTLPDNLNQINFFRALRHIQKYNVRDSLIGIKKELNDESIGHFIAAQHDKQINLLVESSDEGKLDELIEKYLALANEVINANSHKS